MIEMGRRAILVAVMVWLTATHPVRADEIKDAIQEAIDAYEAGDYSAAAGQLDYAAQLVRQLKGGKFRSFCQNRWMDGPPRSRVPTPWPVLCSAAA